MRIDNVAAGFETQAKARLGATEPSTKELKDLKKACQQFEAVFAKKLLAEMRRNVKETQFGDQVGAEIYKDMMDQTLADSIASRGLLGIGDIMYRDFAPRLAPQQPAATDNKTLQAPREAEAKGAAPTNKDNK